MSLKLNDNLLIGIDSREKTINDIKEDINKKGLVNFVDEDSVLIRYPPDMFLQRIHKFVPGYEAYPMSIEVIIVFIISIVIYVLFYYCIIITILSIQIKWEIFINLWKKVIIIITARILKIIIQMIKKY